MNLYFSLSLARMVSYKKYINSTINIKFKPYCYSIIIGSLLLVSACSSSNNTIKSSLPASSAIIGSPPRLLNAHIVRRDVKKIIPLIKHCYGIDDAITTSLIERSTAPSNEVFDKSHFFSFLDKHELKKIIWIPNRPHPSTDNFSAVAHELTHIALTYKESLRLNKQIKKLPIKVPIQFSQSAEVEPAAYLLQYIIEKRKKYLPYRSRIIAIYKTFDINLPCIIRAKNNSQWKTIY